MASIQLDDLLRALPHEERPYKSRGERRVAGLLDNLGIPYRYEEPVLVRAGDYWRIWYPDFTLQTPGRPRVEYFGVQNDPQYTSARRYKERVYAANGIPVLSLLPPDLDNPAGTADRLNRLAGYRSPSRYVQPTQLRHPHGHPGRYLVERPLARGYGRR